MSDRVYTFADLTPIDYPELTSELRKVAYWLSPWFNVDVYEVYTDLWYHVMERAGREPDFLEQTVSYIATHAYWRWTGEYDKYIAWNNREQREIDRMPKSSGDIRDDVELKVAVEQCTTDMLDDDEQAIVELFLSDLVRFTTQHDGKCTVRNRDMVEELGIQRTALWRTKLRIREKLQCLVV